MKHFLRIPLILGVCCLCCAAPLSAQTAENIRADYEARLLTLPADHVRRTVDGAAAETAGPLRFLYAYMSLPDMADYSPQFYVEQVETSLRARREMPWGSRVPEREWLHFVLPVRVNNEHLDRFRTVCYEELRERVRGLKRGVRASGSFQERTRKLGSFSMWYHPRGYVSNFLGRPASS